MIKIIKQCCEKQVYEYLCILCFLVVFFVSYYMNQTCLGRLTTFAGENLVKFYSLHVHKFGRDRMQNVICNWNTGENYTATYQFANSPVILNKERFILKGLCGNPHQLSVVWDLHVGVGVRKEQHLGVGMDGEEKFDSVLVSAQEIGHSLHLRLGLGILPTVNIRTGIAGCSLRFIMEEWGRKRVRVCWRRGVNVWALMNILM